MTFIKKFTRKLGDYAGECSGKQVLRGSLIFLNSELNVNNLKIVIYSITEVKKVKMREEKRRDMAKVLY